MHIFEHNIYEYSQVFCIVMWAFEWYIRQFSAAEMRTFCAFIFIPISIAVFISSAFSFDAQMSENERKTREWFHFKWRWYVWCSFSQNIFFSLLNPSLVLGILLLLSMMLLCTCQTLKHFYWTLIDTQHKKSPRWKISTRFVYIATTRSSKTK